MTELCDNYTIGGGVDMNSSDMAFDNLTILKEFGNIANLVRDEDFLDTVPKAKLKRVKWLPMFNCLKQGILDDMVQELNAMWEEENMPEKIEIVEKQKVKYAECNDEKWRPQLGDIQSQLRAHEVANLQKQKKMLEILAKEYENRVNRLKKSVIARRGYLKAMLVDFQKYTKKSDDCIAKLGKKIDRHTDLAKTITSERDIEEIDWSEKEMGLNLENDNNI